ncbi:hypothetical protein F2Q69_00005670 [Brassica cretica]|uniref:Uncharacterized protein n=1 Tax=Brassica cretica TaxID=69181 RepID=A0A8S9P4A4_BRACR|nr:hypothetical protein F2Q69_00005670 [Brassica cretica]
MYGGPTSCKNAPSLIGFVILQKKKDSKREMKKLSPVNYSASSEYDNFSSYTPAPRRPDPRQTQLHPALRTSRVPDCKCSVRIRAARDPDCNSSRSKISCSRLQPQSIRIQASSCSARVQLAFLPSSRFIILVVRFQQSTKTKGKFEF